MVKHQMSLPIIVRHCEVTALDGIEELLLNGDPVVCSVNQKQYESARREKKKQHDLRRLSRAHRYARKQERTAAAPMASFVVVEWYHTDSGGRVAGRRWAGASSRTARRGWPGGGKAVAWWLGWRRQCGGSAVRKWPRAGGGKAGRPRQDRESGIAAARWGVRGVQEGTGWRRQGGGSAARKRRRDGGGQARCRRRASGGKLAAGGRWISGGGFAGGRRQAGAESATGKWWRAGGGETGCRWWVVVGLLAATPGPHAAVRDTG